MQISVIPETKIYYNETNHRGIFVCATDSKEVKLSKDNTITILGSGNMPFLEKGRRYNAEVEEVTDKKFGIQYKVKHIFETIPTNDAEEKEYLKIMLTENQVEEIYKVYPEGNIIELMENDEFNYKKVKGLGDKTYNKVKTKLIANLKFQKALVELNKFGITYRMIMKLMDKYKYTEVVLRKVKENPYILADEVSGISFIKCDVYALNMGIEKESNIRINACIKYVLKDEADNNGHTWMYKKDVIDRVEKLLDINRELIVNYIEGDNEIDLECLFNNKQRLEDLWVDDKRIALEKNYICEHNIYNKIQELINTECKWLDVNDEEVEKLISEIEQEERIKDEKFTFTDQQRQAIKLGVKENVLIINGQAGSGKSFVLKCIIKILQKLEKEIELLWYATCALSGKAVQRIKELGIDSYTIHKLLKYKRNEGFLYNKNNKLLLNVVALDETSMVNIDLTWQLIQAIFNGSKLILLGDIEQLEPIGAGFVLRDLIDNVPTITLNKIHRQAEKSGIITVASKIRNGEVVDKKGVYGELKDFYLYPYLDREIVYNQIVSMCKSYKGSIDKGKEDIMNLQVLVPMKEKGLCTKKLNKDLQNVFNENIDKVLKMKDKEYRVGDKIIQNGNNYEKFVYIEEKKDYDEEDEKIDIHNGSIGRVLNIKQGNLLIDFDGVIVEYYREDLADIDLAYAITIHKWQGSQTKNIIFGLDYSNYIMLSKQLIYTGITRAEKSCIVVCELDAWRYGIRKNRGERNTFLREMFEGE
jgi:RecD/TraA family predicted helicase